MSEKTITAAKFLDLNIGNVTFVDVREKDDVLVHPLGNAVNIPFSLLSKHIDEIPKDKHVYVICSVGDLSEEVVEILADRGYDAYSIDGGFKAYEQTVKEKVIKVDAKGLKCPGPIVKVADEMRQLSVGQHIIVEATEEAFTSDIAVWCERTGNKLIKLDTANSIITAEIEKADAPAEKIAEVHNDKTFIVFSGDLDKTIAAFIIANGAVSMGRKVTMFFTFWGLNILRRPKKVKAANIICAAQKRATVTPLYIDHSALDSYMFVVEMCGKRILYTGDFRDHGIPGSDRFDRLIQKYVGKVDILITEGTMLSRLEEAKKNPVQTEDDLGREAEKIFAAHHENVVIVSSTNVDSVMEFYHHTPTGMAFLCDAYQAEIMQAAIKAVNKGKYRYGKNIYVLCPDNKKAYMHDLNDRHFIMADKTKYDEKGFVMLARSNNPRFRELLGNMKDPHITYSMWSGYLKGGKCEDRNIVDFLSGHDDEAHFTQLHTSGHAYVETLAKLIEMTKPEVIIPMHTESADEFAKMPKFAAYKDRVNVLRDGEVYKINMEFDINGFINTEKPEDSICREERQYAALLYDILLLFINILPASSRRL